MQKIGTIIHQPMLAALLISIAVHAALFQYRARLCTPAAPILESGRTVVQLTLLPAAASSPEPEAVLPPKKPEAVRPEPAPTPLPEPIESPAEPVPLPLPEPVKEVIKPEIAQPLHTAGEEVTATAPPSTEQDAALESDKGVSTTALVASSFRPTYPRISRRRGEAGTVVLSIQVLANGSAGDVQILQSSGYHRLDNAALQGAKQVQYTPALQHGEAIRSTLQLSYTFRLTDD
jgi:protein TonB